MGDQPVSRPLSRDRITQTQNKYTQTFILGARIEPTTLVFEWAKKVHALNSVDAVIG
jgi:hypothetical protein